MNKTKNKIFNNPKDIMGKEIETFDRLLLGEKVYTESGYYTMINFARVIAINYTKEKVVFVTPNSNELKYLNFNRSNRAFVSNKRYFEKAANPIKFHSGSLHKEENIEVDDRVIYINTKSELNIARVIDIKENGDIEIIGRDCKRSNIIKNNDKSRKVKIHTKGFFVGKSVKGYF